MADLRHFSLLKGGTARRLGFLRDENSQSGLGLPCRLPGCHGTFERETGRGRAKWFHDRKCALEFQRRRRALDLAIDELADQYSSGVLAWSQREELEWDVRWLLGVRTAYFSPSDWAATGVERLHDSSVTTDQLIDAWRRVTRRPSRPNDRCPTCRGAGDLGALRAPVPDGPIAQQRLITDLGAEIYSLLTQLVRVRVPEAGQWMYDCGTWAKAQREELHRALNVD